jgi:hypothetical protein
MGVDIGTGLSGAGVENSLRVAGAETGLLRYKTGTIRKSED